MLIIILIVGILLVLSGSVGIYFGTNPVPVPIVGWIWFQEWDKIILSFIVLVIGIYMVYYTITHRTSRPDGTFISKDLSLFRRLMPHIMRGRIESQIFIPIKINVTRTMEYLKELEKKVEKKRGEKKKLTLFPLYLTALVRTLAFRPQLNRFVAGPSDTYYYQRNHISFSFVAKKKRTDHAKETTVRMAFSPYETIFSVIEKLHGSIKEARSDEGNQQEKEIKEYKKLPFWFMSFLIKAFRWLDKHNLAPTSMIESDPMYSTGYVANMGSMKGITRQFCAPFHHLFTWGTCSLFFGIGTVYDELFKNEETGKIETRKIQELILTYDDRISEGLYGAKGITFLTDFIENPEQLEEVPDIPADLIDELQLKEGYLKKPN